uniref:barH-like 2 homeobox protein n=1 Tax=Fragaria vesca subsp. vesca TaxID=101020 RepID=UPI0005C9AF36|nr:PREDICTED: barH-like 2 homeobox protein [Fragaria vesca subsp. vesca]
MRGGVPNPSLASLSLCSLFSQSLDSAPRLGTRQHLAPPPPRLGSTSCLCHLTSHLHHLDFTAPPPPRFENWAAPRLSQSLDSAPRLGTQQHLAPPPPHLAPPPPRLHNTFATSLRELGSTLPFSQSTRQHQGQRLDSAAPRAAPRLSDEEAISSVREAFRQALFETCSSIDNPSFFTLRFQAPKYDCFWEMGIQGIVDTVSSMSSRSKSRRKLIRIRNLKRRSRS